MTENIEDRIMDIIATEARIDRARLEPSSTMGDFQVSSITQFEVVFAIEEAFDIEMPEEQEDLTLEGLARTVTRLMEQKQSA